MKTSRGEATVVVIVVVAVIGAALWVFKPSFLDGDSRRAKQSQEATAELLAAQKQRSADAAASVVKISEANATAPASPEKDFIGREAPVALSNLEAPDPKALIEAERRKVAVLTGQIEVANSLYEKALKAAQENAERARAAEEMRQQVDAKLAQVAAERLGAERQTRMMIAVAAVLLGLWVYTKISHLSPNALAEAVTDLRTSGDEKAIAAIDTVASRTQQRLVRLFTKLHK